MHATLPQKVRAIRRVYARLDADIERMQKASRLHCLSGCGECCKKPDIEATPVEFLPLALDYFDRGEAESVHEQLGDSSTTCFVFRPHLTSFGGLCNAYPDRGLICRLFGFTARVNRLNQPELVTCKFIKSEQAKEFESWNTQMASGASVPIMTNYYSRMASIDPGLNTMMPINQAMRKALEVVMHYYAYRKRRKPRTAS
jgi:Fe-S-cluster containining protein